MTTLFNNTYKGRRVLITGHTGFKGSWLTLWLKELGAEICGVSLDPETTPNHWDLLNLEINDCRCDIRKGEKLKEIFSSFQPEIVFHLAAQPLVRRSYLLPIETWTTNVIGTAEVLEACRVTSSIKSILCITSDKCYLNNEWEWGYRETDTLGGHDPYSSSKACSELLISSYRKSFFNQQGEILIASARAGNVIGGGDWSEDRLIPDVIRSIYKKNQLIIRNPNSTRPWQHVLDCISGYLLLGQRLIEKKEWASDAWNFGPGDEGNFTVEEVLTKVKSFWPEVSWKKETQKNNAHEASFLKLDCSKSSSKLSWKPLWSSEKAIYKTTQWYRRLAEEDHISSNQDISDFCKDAFIEELTWIK